MNWHIDSKAELLSYSILTIALDLAAFKVAISGIIVGTATIPETAGASVALALASFELLSVAGIDLAYDASSIISYSLQFKEKGEVDVNKIGFVVPGILIDIFQNKT